MTPLMRLVKYIHFLHNVNGKSVTLVYFDRNYIYYKYQMDQKMKAL